jgi:hypothetical protein
MGGGKKKPAGSQSESTDSPVIPVDDFKLYLIEALKDPTVSTQLKCILQPDLDDLTDRVVAKLDRRLKQLNEEVAKRDDEILQLKAEINLLKSKADDVEQYSRRTSVRFVGIKEPKTNDQPEAEVIKILQAVGLQPIIQRCHRVGPASDSASAPAQHAPTESLQVQPRPKGPRAIICQFTGQKDKLDVMRIRKDVQKVFPGVAVFEDLTRARASLAFQARKLKKEHKLESTWTFDGKVIVKDLKGVIHLIRSPEDLTKLTRVASQNAV